MSFFRIVNIFKNTKFQSRRIVCWKELSDVLDTLTYQSSNAQVQKNLYWVHSSCLVLNIFFMCISFQFLIADIIINIKL